MIDRWANLEQLCADGRRILRWIKRQGIVMCCDSIERERAKEFLLPVFRVLEDTIRAISLCAVYLLSAIRLAAHPADNQRYIDAGC